MAAMVCEENNAFYANFIDNQHYIENKGKAATFFKSAPLVIAVFMSELEYYNQKTIEV